MYACSTGRPHCVASIVLALNHGYKAVETDHG